MEKEEEVKELFTSPYDGKQCLRMLKLFGPADRFARAPELRANRNTIIK
jgi:hypothetical protein